MRQFSIFPAAEGVRDVYDLPEPDFLNLCWSLRSYKGG